VRLAGWTFARKELTQARVFVIIESFAFFGRCSYLPNLKRRKWFVA
jgi:hypothetical protein